MKSTIKIPMKQIAMLVALLFATTAFSQTPVEKAKGEMKEMFGVVPAFFNVFPEHALPGVWEYFKQMSSPDAKIPPKYRELLQLAVAAQIPCQYCVYFHTAAAKANGATDDEVREAIAQGAATRHWSMILQGNQIDYNTFKAEVDQIMKHMSAQKP